MRRQELIEKMVAEYRLELQLLTDQELEKTYRLTELSKQGIESGTTLVIQNEKPVA
jgi:hypothetical protein